MKKKKIIKEHPPYNARSVVKAEDAERKALLPRADLLLALCDIIMEPH